MTKPASIDHRGRQTPVRDQGNRGTCTAFGVSAAHEWAAGFADHLSPEDAIWAGHQVAPSREEAVHVHEALGGLDIHRHASEAAWPYGAPAWPAARPAAAALVANQSVLPAWQPLPTPIDLSLVRGHLDVEQPVILTLRVVHSAWQAATGVIDAAPGRKTPASHVVVAVGIDEEDRMLIKNSWGAKWGLSGFAYVTPRYLDAYYECGHVLLT